MRIARKYRAVKFEFCLTGITCSILMGLEPILQEFSPDRILVHGDTSTTFAASLAAYYQKIPVGHVEAGLRTHNIYSPWPEEATAIKS
jgi:UDP-N-acetylglucosamine 2-epimerase (non-hydrolysing)